MKNHTEPLIIDALSLEREAWQRGIYAAGADEAGRGPLAGPVVAAAVIMPRDIIIEGVADSKKLSEKKRELLYCEITEAAVCWAVGQAEVSEIEELNILGAARLAFGRAIEALPIKPDVVYADYITGLKLSMPVYPIVKGDARVYSIAAASIIAKVTRDRLMRTLDTKYPEYGFIRHKGYGTAEHTRAILEHGACPEHRPSFLKKLYEKNGL